MSVGAVGFSMFRSVGLAIALNPKAHVNLLAWALGTCREGLLWMSGSGGWQIPGPPKYVE